MSAAFFGKGVGASGGAVIADTAPKEIMGPAGGLFKRREVISRFPRIQIRYIDRGRLKFSDGLCLKIRCLYSAR